MALNVTREDLDFGPLDEEEALEGEMIQGGSVRLSCLIARNI